MYSIICNATILLSTLILGILTFSKEIADNTRFKRIDKLGFKLIILILGVILGGLATIVKEHNADTESDRKSLEIKSLQDQLYKEVKGGGFPLIRPIIDDGVLNIYLQNPDTVSIYSISIFYQYNYSAISGSAWDRLLRNNYKSLFSDSDKNNISLSISPKGVVPIYKKDISKIPYPNIPYQMTIAWRDDSYNVFMILFKRHDVFEVDHLEYQYKGKIYNEEQFEKKFYPHVKIQPLNNTFHIKY